MLKERSAVVGGMEESTIVFGCEYRGFYKLLAGMVDGLANVIESSCLVNLKIRFSRTSLSIYYYCLFSFFLARVVALAIVSLA
jgi:hypothetical protein